MNRSARTHKSTKIPNVKLRPAPAPAPGPSSRSSRDGFCIDRNAQAGPSRLEGKRARDVDREEGVSAMDRVKIRRMEDEDGVVDNLSHDAFHNAPSQLPFHDHTLTYTSISTTEKADLNPLLQSMGIKSIHAALTEDCTLLLSRTFNSPKYLCALEREIPVFMPELIEEVHARWIEGDDVGDVLGPEWAAFRLKPFYGAKIAVTGIEPFARRQEVISLIADNGGVYSKNLDRSCTHLIVANKERNPTESQSDPRKSAKVDFALGQPAEDEVDEAGEVVVLAGPRVIWEEWLWDCVALQGRWDESGWDLRTQRHPPRQEDSMVAKIKAQTEERERLQRREQDSKAARKLLDAVVAEERPVVKREAEAGGDGILHQALPSDVLEPARLRRRSEGRGSGRNTPQAQGMPKVGQDLDRLLSSFNQAVQSRPFDGDVGQAANDVEDQSNVARRPKLLAVQTTMDVKGRVSPLLRSSVLHNSRNDAFAVTDPISPIVSSASGATPASLASTGAIAPTAPPQSSAADADYVCPDLYHGLSFSYPLTQGERSRQEKVTMEQVLTKCGGTMVSEEDRLGGTKVDYVVVKLQDGRPPVQVDGAATQLVTDCWVERCLFRKKVVSPDEHLVLKPLEREMPLPGAAAMSIHITGFDEEDTFYYKRLIRAMGSDFSTAFSRKRTTHLMCRTVTPTGLKVVRALEWQVPIMTVEWLIQSVVAGELLPWNNFSIDTTNVHAAPIPSVSKQPLGADHSANLSASHHDIGIALPPSASGTSSHHKENMQQIEADSVNSKGGSQKSSSQSRRLGLIPTEVNISHAAAKPAKRSMVEDSVMDIDVDIATTKSSAGPLAKAAAAPAGPDTPRTERPPPRVAVPRDAHIAIATPVLNRADEGSALSDILTPEIMKELEQADVHAEARQARVLRRSRQNPRSRNPFALNRAAAPLPGPSRLYSPVPDLTGGDMGGDPEQEEAEDDAGDQSLRVVYADPAAEKEKKRLMDAFGDRKSKRVRKS